MVSKDTSKESLCFFFSKKRARFSSRWRINTVKGRETTGQLYTLVFQDDCNLARKCLSNVGDRFSFFSFFAKPKMSGRRGSGQNSMEVVRESKVLTRSTTRYRSYLGVSLCFSGYDAYHFVTRSMRPLRVRVRVYGHCVEGKGVKKKRTGQEKNMEDKGILCSP